jgi:anthranilate phosphoribosyltransferase
MPPEAAAIAVQATDNATDECMTQTSEQEQEGPDLAELLVRATGPEPLSGEDTEAAFGVVMEGRATPVQIACLLTALKTRRETPSIVAGGVRALRRAMVPVPADDVDALVDTCGTGGGVLTTFNISTAAALVAAGAGVRIAKHGNRSFSSRCGSADILEAMGVRIELSPEGMGEVLKEAGIVFMFAPLLHPAMRHVAPVRRELRMPTVMNMLGPLTNPAGARRQVVGVADPRLVELIAGALKELGHLRALVVHGEPGIDELSPIGPTRILELRDGALSDTTVDLRDHLPGRDLDPSSLAGGDPADNARLVRAVLEGTAPDAARAAVVVNAAAAIYLGERAHSLVEGIDVAEDVISSGAALDVLHRLRDASARAA